jgi:hypothetical protein
MELVRQRHVIIYFTSAFSRFGLKRCSVRTVFYKSDLQTSLVVWWSDLLTTKHEVPGSIPGSSMGIFPCRGIFHGNFPLQGKIPTTTMDWVACRI